jgi:hypothetical protein
MTFRLTPNGTGPALSCTGFLQAADKTGCLQGRTAALGLRKGEPQTARLVLTRLVHFQTRRFS